jgi:hypothetical protein
MDVFMRQSYLKTEDKDPEDSFMVNLEDTLLNNTNIARKATW